MDNIVIDGVIITPLKQILNPKGDILHGLKKSDQGYSNFGEAYFSSINYNDIKPWKKHHLMTLNLIVPVGTIRFVLFDNREFSKSKGIYNEFTLSKNNYCRLTIPPGIWFAFKGENIGLNLLLNIADIEHSPTEIERLELNDIHYNW